MSFFRAIPLLVAFSLLLPIAAKAADDPTAEHRRLYAETNAALKGMQKQKYEIEIDGDPAPLEVQTWNSGAYGNIPDKIVVSSFDDHGGSVQELYFGPTSAGAELKFIFEAITTQAIDGSHKTVQENRYYFQDGRMFRWLDHDKTLVSPGSGEFQDKAESLTELSSILLSRYAQPKKTKKSAATGEEMTGTFEGIEEGDYTHLFLKKGKERFDFYVLETDTQLERLLENPGKYKGKTLSVVTQTSTEYLESAGGNVEITKVITVRLPN